MVLVCGEFFALLIAGCLVVSMANPTQLASFRFATTYSDSMVLQREPHPASIWGFGGAGTSVTVAIVDSNVGTTQVSVTTTTRPDGKWRLSLPAQPASNVGVNITATSPGSPTITIGDVLFGDVWVCSGQSNMAFSVGVPLTDPRAEAQIAQAYASDPGASMHGQYVNTSAAIATAAQYADVRFVVTGNHHTAPTPIDDFFPSGTNDSTLPLAQAWQKSSSTSVGSLPDVMGGLEHGQMSAVCWFFGVELHMSQKVPIGLIHASYGGSAIEDWLSNTTLGDGTDGPCPGIIDHSMGLPTQQYNGQLHPLLNTTIKGAIWYQGESNGGQDLLYSCRFGQLMDEWRREWSAGTEGATDASFPVGFVQIGPWGADDATYAIRNGQTAGYGYAPNPTWPRTFMSTAFDLANPPDTKCFAGCVHVFNKQAVAHRLAVGARATVYNESGVVFSGPRLSHIAVGKGNTLVVTYDAIGTEGGGIKLRGSYGFEVSTAPASGRIPTPAPPPPPGPAAVWVHAPIVASTPTSVTLQVPANVTGGAAGVRGVRYAFTPCSVFTATGPAVFNAEGLPATPSMYNMTVPQAAR
eukprot:m.321347 g.321347  ORF g.321347 m.321347 type:complete len:580 (+) comp20333_c0_seq3:219-1958(+)